MGLSKAKLKEAVAAYGPLHTEGKTAEEIKSTITAAGYKPAEVEEIYNAITDDGLVDHVVTQEDLDNNPELVAEGVEVGDTIRIPKKDDKPAKPSSTKKKSLGKVTVTTEFRDKDNWDKLYKVGDDISHFDEGRLTDIINRGLGEAE